MTLVQIFISLPLSFSSLGLRRLFCRGRLKSAMYNRFFLPRGLTKRFSKGLRFVDLGGFSTKQRPPWFRVNWRLTKRLTKGLRFVDLGGLFYKTKTPLISRQLASDKVFLSLSWRSITTEAAFWHNQAYFLTDTLKRLNCFSRPHKKKKQRKQYVLSITYPKTKSFCY